MINEIPNGYRIQDIEESERPRERLAALGPQALSNAELLAILLRVGTRGENAVQVGQRLLHDLRGLQGIHQATFQEVCQQHGMGPAKAAQIKAAVELGRRLMLESPEERPVIQCPRDAANLVSYEMAVLPQEHLRVLNLDTRNRVISINEVYKGSLNASMVRVGELFKSAIQCNAASLIMVHNHPSGDPTPSPEDINLTRVVREAGKLMDIALLDHIIIGQGRHVSLKEKNLGFG
jgi:DNA repair protein RadC